MNHPVLMHCRQHGLTVTVFLVPHVALMSLPMLGPLAFIPVQAAAAWLVDLIESKAGPQPLRPESQAHKAAELTPISHLPQPGSKQQWNNPNPPGSTHKWTDPDPAGVHQPSGGMQPKGGAQYIGNPAPGSQYPRNQQWRHGQGPGQAVGNSRPLHGSQGYDLNAALT